MHLFTYGSLMFPQVWSVVVRGDYKKQSARLHGHQRRSIKGETYPAAIVEGWEANGDLIREAIDGAIESTGIMPTDIDYIIIGNMVGGETAEQAHLGTLASGMLPHRPPSLRVEAACASGGLAIHTACAFLESGKAETILVLGAEKLTDVANDMVTSALMRAGDAEKDAPAGLTFPSIFALTATAYMHKYGLKREDF